MKILIFAYFLEGMGFVVQASFLPDILNLLSGAIYGNTMMGLTALFMSYGASLAPKSSAPIMSALTAAYAIGTIIAPLYCAKIFNIYQSYDRALVLTAIFVGLSALSLCVIKFLKKEQKCHLSMSK